MRINERIQMMMMVRESLLPFVKPNEGAYIDTGFRAEGGMKMEVRMRITGNIWIAPGSHNNVSSDNYYNRNQIYPDDTGKYVSFNKCDVYANQSLLVDNNIHTYTYDAVGHNVIGIVDGVECINVKSVGVLHPTNNVVIGMDQYDGSYMPDEEIYYLKLWNSNYQLVRNFVPYMMDNVAGLYDLVHGMFYHSKTTVEFYGKK